MSMLFLAVMDEPTKWLVFSVASLTMVYVVMRPWVKKKDPLATQPHFSSLSQQRAVERQMSNLLVELSEMARQTTAQLDTRSTKLDLLIREADEKIALLKSLTGAAPNAQAAAAPPPTPAAASAETPMEADARYVEIYSLADQGCSVREIGRRLNRPHGEIELILALRLKR